MIKSFDAEIVYILLIKKLDVTCDRIESLEPIN